MAKRGSDDSQDSATAAPAIRLSSNFQDSSADIELRSKDGVRFLVHKANLSVSSTVFADMLQLATGGDQERPSLELDESAGVLESMLLYCYPKRVPPLEINPDADLKLLRALDKYEFTRGLEAVEASFRQKLADGKCSGSVAFYALIFAHHRRLDALFDLAFPVLLRHSARLGTDNYFATLDSLAFIEASDLRDLVDFCLQRKVAMLSAHAAASESILDNVSDGFREGGDYGHGRLQWDGDGSEIPPCFYPFLQLWYSVLREGNVTARWVGDYGPCGVGADKVYSFRCRCCSEAFEKGINMVQKELGISEKAEGLNLWQEKLMGGQYRAWAAKKRASRA